MLHHLRRAIGAAGLVLVIATGPLAAHSPETPPQQAQKTASATPHLRSQRAIRFDWHANRTTAAPHSTTATRSRSAPGRGSYICTAAGSGQMSRCVAR